MQVSNSKTYLSSKKDFKSRNDILEKIDHVIKALEEDAITPNMEFKKIVCKRSKIRHSIRVIGTQYRILLDADKQNADLVCICNHDRYAYHNKHC
jgi:hypothetical protein